MDAVRTGCSMQCNSGIWRWGHCLWCKKVKPVDAVDAVCSGIVVYGDGDIVFGVKRSKQWTQYSVDAVCSGHSGIVVYGGGDIVLGAEKVKPVDAVDTVHSRCSKQWTQYLHSGYNGCSGMMVYGGGDIVFGAKRSNQWMQWMQYAVDTVDAVE